MIIWEACNKSILKRKNLNENSRSSGEMLLNRLDIFSKLSHSKHVFFKQRILNNHIYLQITIKKIKRQITINKEKIKQNFSYKMDLHKNDFTMFPKKLLFTNITSSFEGLGYLDNLEFLSLWEFPHLGFYLQHKYFIVIQA